MRKKKKRTPSRMKYEQSHPTVSFRVSKELYDRLEVVKEAEGKSTTDVLKIGVDLLEVKVSNEKEARRQGYEEGFEKGFEEAKNLYMITFPCSVCRKTIEVAGKGMKETIRKILVAHGLGHAKH